MKSGTCRGCGAGLPAPFLDLGPTPLANAYLKPEDLDRAERDYRKALELSPTLPDAHVGLGNVARDKGAHAQARVGYQKALSILDKHSGAHREYAWLLATCPNANVRDGVKALA